MKTPAELRAVGARLEEAVALLPGSPGSPEEQYERYEEMAIAILDSEHAEFRPGLLEEYLRTVLHLKAMELGGVSPIAADA
jgi:hypothetical protein